MYSASCCCPDIESTPSKVFHNTCMKIKEGIINRRKVGVKQKSGSLSALISVEIVLTVPELTYFFFFIFFLVLITYKETRKGKGNPKSSPSCAEHRNTLYEKYLYIYYCH